jgi:hypothetical protein
MRLLPLFGLWPCTSPSSWRWRSGFELNPSDFLLGSFLLSEILVIFFKLFKVLFCLEKRQVSLGVLLVILVELLILLSVDISLAFLALVLFLFIIQRRLGLFHGLVTIRDLLLAFLRVTRLDFLIDLIIALILLLAFLVLVLGKFIR